MTWMLTIGGHVAEHTAPELSGAAININTLAHALACINRYTGHALRPISVAEHSLLVADIVATQMHLGIDAQLAALLHDAHEAFTNDLATPAKQRIGPAWREFEDSWQLVVRRSFSLRYAFLQYGEAIRQADLIALATERRDLLPPDGPRWPSLDGIQPLPNVNLRDRDSFTWADWRQAFLDRYAELDFARSRLLSRA